MPRKHRIESPGLQHLYDRYIGNDPKQQEIYESELLNAQIARELYDMRTKADLTQTALAKKVGTTASVISRLEDARYQGHSITMLRKLAEAFNVTLQIHFQPLPRSVSKPKRKLVRAAA